MQVAVGKCIRRHPTWPPTIPEFVALCDVDAEELGLPSDELAWLEAQKKANGYEKYSHQAIHEAVKRAGAYDIARATTQSEQNAMKNKFCSEYNSLAKAMANGTALIESDKQHNQQAYLERATASKVEKTINDMGLSGITREQAMKLMRERLKA